MHSLKDLPHDGSTPLLWQGHILAQMFEEVVFQHLEHEENVALRLVDVQKLDNVAVAGYQLQKANFLVNLLNNVHAIGVDVVLSDVHHLHCL